MKATKWMLSVLGRLLQRLGALLVHATDDVDAKTSPGAGPDDTPPVFDARQAWLRRVAGVPPHAWQGRGDTPPRRSRAIDRGLVRTDITTSHKSSAPTSAENDRLQAAGSASQTTAGIKAWAAQGTAAEERGGGQRPVWPSSISALAPARHGAPVWDQGTESGGSAPAAPIADTSVVAASLTSHPPQEVDGGRGRGSTPQPTATARERLRSLVARFMGGPAWLEPAQRGTEATQTVPDRPHEGLAPRRDQSPPQTLSSPPTAGRKPREGAALAVQAETIVQPEATVTAKPPHTAAVQTRTVASERASATWHAQTYAPQPKSEHEAADVGVDPAPATPLPPKHARTARALSQPVASHSHAPHPRSEHETAGVGVDRAPATPLRPERASAALAPTRPIASRSSARNAPRSRPQVLGHFPDSPDSPSSQHRIPLEPTAARMSFAMPMSSDAVEFAAAVWPDLPSLPWADQERHSSRQSWHEFVRLERLDAEQRG